MRELSCDNLFSAYCYGPADLVELHKGDSTMWLELRDSSGRRAKAIYHGCVYWMLDETQLGSHISLVQRLSINELLQPAHASTFRSLRENTLHVEKLLREWEDEGLSFYIHLCRQADTEFLVVADSLEYRELD